MWILKIRTIEIFFLCSLLGCQHSNKKKHIETIVNELSGKEIIYTENLVERYTLEEKQFFSNLFQQKNMKVITFINVDCGYCIESLPKWKNFSKENDLCLFLIIEDHNMEFYESICNDQSLGFNYVLYDKDNIFEKFNKIPSSTSLRTLLLDSLNRVLIIGNPIYNDAINDLYKKVIEKNKNDK